MTPPVASTLSVGTFTYTGSAQSFVVPLGVTSIRVKIWGAGGGGSFRLNQYSYGGGSGGYAECLLDVVPGETLNVVVGGGGSVRSATTRFSTVAGVTRVSGGYGGGGNATQPSTDTPTKTAGNTSFGDYGSGGGRSAIQRGGSDLVTAGGGGGGGMAIGDTANSVSLWECHNYGGPGGGLTGGAPSAADAKNCQTTASAGSQTTGGVSVCGQGAALRGGQSTQRGSGGGGGWYGGAPGCNITVASLLTSAQRMYVTGGTGGSGYLGGCRVGSPALSLGGKAGNVYVRSGPPRDSDRAYVAGVGLGGRSVGTTANFEANGGNGLVFIEVFHTLPTAPPTQAPFSGASVLAPTPLPTIDSGAVYKFPRVSITSDGKAYNISTSLPGALSPVRVASLRSPNTNKAAYLFDGIRDSSSLAFSDNVCDASAASAANCLNPYGSTFTTSYLPCLYRPTYRFTSATSAALTKYQADPIYKPTLITYTNSTIVARFPSSLVGCQTSGSVTSRYNICDGNLNTAAQSSSSGYNSHAKNAIYNAVQSLLPDPFTSGAAYGQFSEPLPYGDYVTVTVAEMVTPTKVVLWSRDQEGRLGKPLRFKIYGTTSALAPWSLVLDQTAEAAVYSAPTSPNSARSYTSPALTSKDAFSQFALVVTEVDVGCSDWQILEFEIYGTSLGLEDPNKSWVQSNYLGEWAKVDLGESVLLKYHKLYVDAQGTGRPSQYRVYGSPDGANWNMVSDQVLRNTSYVSSVYTSPTAKPVNAYRWYAIVFAAVETGAQCLRVLEWELYGSLPPLLPPQPKSVVNATQDLSAVSAMASALSYLETDFFDNAQCSGPVTARRSQVINLCEPLNVPSTVIVGTLKGTFPASSAVITVAAVVPGLKVGQAIQAAGFFPADSVVASFTQTTITVSSPATVGGTDISFNVTAASVSATSWHKRVLTSLSPSQAVVLETFYTDAQCSVAKTTPAPTSVTYFLTNTCTMAGSGIFSNNDPFTYAQASIVADAPTVFPGQGFILEGFLTPVACADPYAQPPLRWFYPSGLCRKSGYVEPAFAMYAPCSASAQGGATPGLLYFNDADCKVPYASMPVDASFGTTGRGLCFDSLDTTSGWRYKSLTCTGPGLSSSAGSSAFRHTGMEEGFVVPAGVTQLTVKLWGAGGGTYASSGPSSNSPKALYLGTNSAQSGGAGGFVQCTIAVTPGERLGVVVGGGGASVPMIKNGPGAFSPGGFGGGGDGLSANANGLSCGGGGGRSAIRRDGQDIVTVGGGGGACEGIRGGGGGGPVGGTPNLPDCQNNDGQYSVPDCAYSVGDGRRSRMVGPGQLDAGRTCMGEYGTTQTWYTGQPGGKYQGGPLAGGFSPWTTDRSAVGWGGGGGGGYYGGSSGCFGGGAGGSGYTGGCIQSLPIVNLQGSVGVPFNPSYNQLDVRSALPPNTFDPDYPGEAVGVAPQVVNNMNAVADAFPARAGHGFVLFTAGSVATPILQKFPRVTNVNWIPNPLNAVNGLSVTQYRSRWPRTPMSDASRALPMAITSTTGSWFAPSVFDGRVSSGEVSLTTAGVSSSFAGDGYTGVFITIDMGEEVLPSFFRIWCSSGASCPGVFRLYGGSKYSNMAARGNSGGFTNTPTMSPSSAASLTWDVLLDQVKPARYDVCTVGSDTSYNANLAASSSAYYSGDSDRFTSRQSPCFSSAVMRPSRSYSKFAWVFRGTSGVTGGSTINLGELELFGALQANAMSPTTSPTMLVSSPQPSPRPSLPLSARPTVMQKVLGEAYYHRTYHSGKKCLSAPVAFIVEPVPLNRCMPKDATNPTPYMFSCKLGDSTYTLSRTLYADEACSVQKAAPTIYAHDLLCKKDSDSAFSLLTSCGPLAPSIRCVPPFSS